MVLNFNPNCSVPLLGKANTTSNVGNVALNMANMNVEYWHCAEAYPASVYTGKRLYVSRISLNCEFGINTQIFSDGPSHRQFNLQHGM